MWQEKVLEKNAQPAYSKFPIYPAGGEVSDEKLEIIASQYSNGARIYSLVTDKQQLAKIVSSID